MAPARARDHDFIAKRITCNATKVEHAQEAMTELEGLVDRRPDPE